MGTFWCELFIAAYGIADIWAAYQLDGLQALAETKKKVGDD